MSTEPLKFGHYYHIYNRGNNGQNIFLERRNYSYFLKLYLKYITSVAQTFAYCLIPNHFHFFIRTLTKTEQKMKESFEETRLIQPSRAFNNMFIAYTKAVNKATGRSGALFERPFERKIVTSEDYFRNLIIYIHQNPQKHGLVDNFRDWKYSSWGAYERECVTNIKRDDVFNWFDGRMNMWDAHRVTVDEECIWHLIHSDDE